MLHISYKDRVTNEEVRIKIQQAIGPHEDLLTIVKRHKLQWYGHVSRSSGLAKTILQGTVKGGKKTRRTKEEVGRQHQGMDSPGVGQVAEGSGEQGKMEKSVCKIICGAPTTLAVKGLMMMMMMMKVSPYLVVISGIAMGQFLGVLVSGSLPGGSCASATSFQIEEVPGRYEEGLRDSGEVLCVQKHRRAVQGQGQTKSSGVLEEFVSEASCERMAQQVFGGVKLQAEPFLCCSRQRR